MAISYYPVYWNIMKYKIPDGPWGKTLETGRGIRVILTNGKYNLIPGTETLKLRYKLANGTYGSIDGTLVDGGWNIEIDDLLATAEWRIQADLELTGEEMTISSASFTIPIFKSI